MTSEISEKKDEDPTKEYLIKKVIPTFCKTVKIYTDLISTIHGQLDNHHAEFEELDSETRHKIQRLVTDISVSAGEIKIHVLHLKTLADADSSKARKKETEAQSMVKELEGQKNELVGKRKTAETELNKARDAQRVADIALEKSEAKVAEAEREKEAAGCRRKREVTEDLELVRRKRFINWLICKIGNAITGRLKSAKQALEATQDEYNGKKKDADEKKAEADKAQEEVKDAETKVGTSEEKLHEKQLEAEGYLKQFQKSTDLAEKMGLLEVEMTRISNHITEHLDVVDKDLTEITSTMNKLNKIFIEFQPPDISHGGEDVVKLMQADLSKLQEFSDKAEKKGALMADPIKDSGLADSSFLEEDGDSTGENDDAEYAEDEKELEGVEKEEAELDAEGKKENAEVEDDSLDTSADDDFSMTTETSKMEDDLSKSDEKQKDSETGDDPFSEGTTTKTDKAKGGNDAIMDMDSALEKEYG